MGVSKMRRNTDKKIYVYSKNKSTGAAIPISSLYNIIVNLIHNNETVLAKYSLLTLADHYDIAIENDSEGIVSFNFKRVDNKDAEVGLIYIEVILQISNANFENGYMQQIEKGTLTELVDTNYDN